jgi:transposase-like protein
LHRVLYGISCRNYETTIQGQTGTIGATKSSVSRGFVTASSQQLKALTERKLDGLDIVAMFLDGKSFANSQMVIALGIALDGKKSVLGFVEADTENGRVLSLFLRSLLDRGLDVSRGLLAIVDGGKGLRSAIKTALAGQALVQRCQWHKREDVVSYLAREEQPWMRKRLQRAYERPTFSEAERALKKIRAELETRNQSAMASLDEGFDETLTLHRLGVFAQLGRSFKTTNCLESINAMTEERCAKVDYWKNSEQKHRWVASALLDIEPRLHRVLGHKQLPLLREALLKELGLTAQTKSA